MSRHVYGAKKLIYIWRQTFPVGFMATETGAFKKNLFVVEKPVTLNQNMIFS